MRQKRPLILAVVLMTGACSSSPITAPPAAPATGASATSAGDSGTGDTGARTAVDPIKACTVLGPADFKTVGFTVDQEGEDVSENFNLSTTTSVACQWTNFDNNQGGSWELVIGTGDATAAYDSDLADKTTSSDNTDHDFEAGVRIGDTYFTMSTTDDKGGDAITALAKLVADRLATSH
jgi:hypothetical protein